MTVSARPGKSLRILLVDDSETVQQSVREVAEARGHHIIRAISGARALAVAMNTQPDIIVLDMGLPDADGRDVLAKLKADERTSRIPVVVWSGRSSQSDSRISLSLGAEDYIEKSDAALLLVKLERVLLKLENPD